MDTKELKKPYIKSTCKVCGKPIIYVGPYWKHQTKKRPDHPATPEDDYEPEKVAA